MDETLILAATQNEVKDFIGNLTEDEWINNAKRFTSKNLTVIPTGVGATNAAIHCSIALYNHGYDRVISTGFGGALPGSNLDIGDVIQGGKAIYADLGIIDKKGFKGMETLGFGTTNESYNEFELTPLKNGLPTKDIATVSSVSATDKRANEVKNRTDAHVETMETAAVAHCCNVFNTQCSAIVSISNNTGDDRGFDKETAQRNLSMKLEEIYL